MASVNWQKIDTYADVYQIPGTAEPPQALEHSTVAWRLNASWYNPLYPCCLEESPALQSQFSVFKPMFILSTKPNIDYWTIQS